MIYQIRRRRRKYLGMIITVLLGFVLWTMLVMQRDSATCTVSTTAEKPSISPWILQSADCTEKSAADDLSLNWLEVEAPILVICVFSRPESIELRNSCRNTWMKKFRRSKYISFKFVVGTGGLNHEKVSTLHSESQTYGDMALLDGHKEEYGPQCTEKLMLTFQWIINHTNATFVMKTDDDCYIRPQCLISQIKQADLHKPFLLGTIIQNAPPNVDGKWKETGWNLTREYLPFAYGSGYVLLRSLIAGIVANDKVFPMRRYNNEDVTLGVWLAPYNISYINMKRTHLELTDSSCTEDALTSSVIHCNGSAERMYEVHKCHYVLQ